MGTNSDVWVVVPTYNEATVVEDVVVGLRQYFPNIVGVDDGSVDESTEALRRAGARVVRHPINMGAGAALQTGIEFALRDSRMRYVVTFDADGQHRAADAAAMVDRIRDAQVNVIIGSRFLESSAIDMSSSKRRLLKLATVFEHLTSGIQLTDAHQGLRVVDRWFAERLRMRTPDMAWASEFLGRMTATGATYEEFPVTVRYTEYSRTKGQRSINSVNIAVDVLLSRLLGGHR